MTTTVRAAALLLCLTTIAACQHEPPRPEAGENVAIVAQPAGVAAANPIAVEAGLAILRAGGSAVDAAVAVQAALGLVEPQSSGIGGGAFLLHYDARAKRITAYDGREAAPRGATPDMFLDEDGQPLPFADAVTSGRSTGVPGAMAMLGVAHQQHGRLPWSQLFDGVERVADDGFVVPKRLARFANGQFRQATLPDARALFGKPDGGTVQAGDTLRNPAYAASLRTLASQGPRALLEPPLAEQIIVRTHAEPRPGTLAPADFGAYRPRYGDALCRPYRVYVVCVPPPPSSGVSLLQMLAILEQTDIARRGPQDPQAWFLFAEASRLMYADRDRYVADPAFVAVPVNGLLDATYVASRAQLIGARAGAPPPAGEPPLLAASARFGEDSTHEVAGTSHFVVVDGDGNVVSMTTSVESLFGSGRAVGGFFLNNQLTDFSFKAVEDDRPVANAIAPGKRPRSSMAPVLVLDGDGRLLAALGSPGGSAILAYNAKALVGLLAWELPLQQAIELPNLVARGKDFFGEASKFPPEVLEGLAARGIEVKSGRGEESGLHGVLIRKDGTLEGAADPRREGVWRQQ
ncbi:MAG: gamma-glutamyltransferase family protein [Steroidobacteraceae bacterium]|nr:gamma-glutamyltransferase family protein [Steroidobacteraceae bacterium]